MHIKFNFHHAWALCCFRGAEEGASFCGRLEVECKGKSISSKWTWKEYLLFHRPVVLYVLCGHTKFALSIQRSCLSLTLTWAGLLGYPLG